MRRPPTRTSRGWFWRLKSTRLSLAAGLGFSLLCVVLWLGWQRDHMVLPHGALHGAMVQYMQHYSKTIPAYLM